MMQYNVVEMKDLKLQVIKHIKWQSREILTSKWTALLLYHLILDFQIKYIAYVVISWEMIKNRVMIVKVLILYIFKEISLKDRRKMINLENTGMNFSEKNFINIKIKVMRVEKKCLIFKGCLLKVKEKNKLIQMCFYIHFC